MSQNNTSILHVGLDVAKASLQLDLAGQPHTLANDAQGHAQLLKRLRAHPGAHVVCEATGGYEQPAVRVLHVAQIPVSIVEAGRVRHFAKAKGLRAKTDPIAPSPRPSPRASLRGEGVNLSGSVEFRPHDGGQQRRTAAVKYLRFRGTTPFQLTGLTAPPAPPEKTAASRSCPSRPPRPSTARRREGS